MKGRKGFERQKEERKIKDPSKLDLLPVKSNGWKTKDGHWAEDFVQKLGNSAEEHGIDPPAAVWTGTKSNVKRHTDQAGTDPRAGQILDEPVCYRLKYRCSASWPQHHYVTCQQKREG